MLQQWDVVATQRYHHASRALGALMDMTSGNVALGVIVEHRGLSSVLDMLGDARRHSLHAG